MTLHARVQAGDNIRPQGSEVRRGEALMVRGQRVGPAEVGALAVLGIDPVPVFRRPKVAILATGDEVVDVRATPQPHQVAQQQRDGSRPPRSLLAGGEPMHLGIVGDSAEALGGAIRKGLSEADVLLSIGGISKGTHDLVHKIYGELGVETVYHGIAFKPGKPTFFGSCSQNGHRCFVFGLPGNPASCFTVFDLLVAPLSGSQLSIRQAEPETLVCRRSGLAFRKNWRLQAIPTGLGLRPGRSGGGRVAFEQTEW